MIRNRHLHRRTLLRGACGAALSLPWLDAMLPRGGLGRRASAQQISPRRVIILNWGNGIPTELWGLAKSKFDAVKQKALFLSGVPIAAAKDGSVSAHAAGGTALLTGSSNDPNQPDSWALTDSVDVFLEQLGQSAGLPFGAYRAQAFAQSLSTLEPQATRVCIQNGAPIPLIDDPKKMYDDLFAGRSLGSSPASSMADAASTLARQRELRVLSATRDKTQALHARLDAVSRTQLEAYLESLAEVERRLNASGGAATASCSDPGMPTASKTTTRNGGVDHASVNEIAEAQVDMLAMALACDLTRVAFFQVTGSGGGGGTTDLNYGTMLDGQAHPQGHHQLTHDWEQGNAGYLSHLEEVIDYTFGLFARLAVKLDSFPEGDGTVLDHTILYLCTETTGSTAYGSIHRQSGADLRNILVGGGDYLKLGGRELLYGGGTAASNVTLVNDANPTNNRLLLHLLRYMGDNRATIGQNTTYCSGGPLSGLT